MASEDRQVSLVKLNDVKSTGKLIGKGAYGRVIEVCVHGMPCAAKEVHSILIENVTRNEFEATKASFLNECARSSRMIHPNMVQVLGIHYPSPEAKLPWLVMELMETSIKLFLENYSKEEVPQYIKLSILVDIAQGLEFLHGQNIVHRDLSSNNVLLTKHFVAKISDLGTAKFIIHGGMKTQTQTPGTLHFMPPEALLVKPRYGKPVDVFSLACVIIHVMSHQWPEPKDRVPEGTMTVLTEVQRREEYLRSCTPLSLKELVELCLHNTPEQRPVIAVVCKDVKALKENADHENPVTTAYSFQSLSDKIKYFKEKSLKDSKLQDQILKNHKQETEESETISSRASEAHYQLQQEKEQLSHQLRDAGVERDKLLEQLREAYSEKEMNEGQLQMLNQNLIALQNQEVDHKNEKEAMLGNIQQLDANLKISDQKLNDMIREYEITVQDLETTVQRFDELQEENRRLKLKIQLEEEENDKLRKESFDNEKFKKEMSDTEVEMTVLKENLAESKQQLEDCQKHLKSKDNDLLAAHKKADAMRSQLSLLEETLAEERERKVEKENELNSIKRSVAQLNMKLAQETSAYDEATKLLDNTYNGKLNNMRADYNKKMDNLQQIISKLQQQVDTLRQDISTKDKERQDVISMLEATHKIEIEDLTNTNIRLNRELGTLKMSVQDKETTLSQLERERNSLKDNVELMREQIQTYDSDFRVERQYREKIAIENSKLNQQIKDMELQFQKIRDGYTIERTTRDLVATENEKLKQELHTCKTQLLHQIEELQRKEGGHVPPPQQGSHVPPLQQGSHVPPPWLQQGVPPLQQGIGQSGIPRNPKAFNSILRTNSNAYTPPSQHPIPPEYRSPQRQADDAAVPADGDPAGVQYPPRLNTYICPICQRNDFDDYETLHLHAAYCGAQ